MMIPNFEIGREYNRYFKNHNPSVRIQKYKKYNKE